MISDAQFKSELQIISNAIQTWAMVTIVRWFVSQIQPGTAKLLVKDDGIIAGVEFAKMIFHYIDPNLTIDTFIADGMPVKYGGMLCFR
jgi:nicotinate-nucleotide pyrophosphorylase (carboxylating)